MTEYIMLGVMAAVILVQLLLRTNVAIAFFALCAGSVLLSATGDEASLVASSLTSGIDTSTNVVKIVLLFAPFAVCVVLLRKHLSAALLPMALIPAACSALLGAIFVTPLLTDGTEGAIMQTQSWEVMVQYQEPIVVLGLVFSMVLVALTIKKPHSKSHKKRGH
jgi:hypothetical protein